MAAKKFRMKISNSESEKNSLIELGDIYFFYRPKVKSTKADVSVHGIDDIQRFYVILHPKRSRLYRLIILGAKRLPEIREKSEKNWAMIDMVTQNKKSLVNELAEHYYHTKTKGKRFLPDARPAGEGVYSIVEHGRNTYLSYSLELPTSIGEPQLDLKIEPNATYVMTIKNPDRGGRRVSKKPKLPVKLKKLFAGLRFMPVRTPMLLNIPDIELILIGAQSGEKFRSLEKNQETPDTADIFNDLNYWRNSHSIVPLFRGRWK